MNMRKEFWVPASKQEWLDEVWKRLRVTLARSERKRWVSGLEKAGKRSPGIR